MLPEGVIQADGNATGFLYFEHVPSDVDRVTLRADLVNPRTGEVFGTVELPFEVES